MASYVATSQIGYLETTTCTALISVAVSNYLSLHSYQTSYLSLFLLTQLIAPAAPREVNATNLSSTEIFITWLQPDPTNGVIQQYIVTYYPSGSPGDNTTNSTSDTSITIGGLSAFTEYSVFVVAVTVAPGPPSTAVNVTTSEAAPTAVRNLMAVAPDLTQISVTWDQPTALNGIVSYIISVVGVDLATQITVLSETSDAVSETQYSFDVEEYAVYVVMVTAVTGGGQGPTVETNFTTPEGVPEAPVNFTVLNVTNISAVPSWLPPGDSNGILTNYTLVLLDQNNEIVNVTILSSDSRQFEFENLIPFTEYSVVLFANTSVGAGMEATTDFMTDVGTPTAVRNLMAVAPDLTQINVTWDQPAALNGVVSYIISIVGMDLVTQLTVLNETVSAVNETQYSFETTVEEYAVYVVMVTAVTGGGQGPTVETNFTTPEGVPEAPVNFTVLNVTNISAVPSWLPPGDSNGILTNYTLVLLDQNNETANVTVLSSESLQFEFENLTPFTDYSVVLFANTSIGAGVETTADFMTVIGSELHCVYRSLG